MKDTLKILSLLEENIERVTENGIYEIERDLLLERLRGLYASVVATEAVAEEDRVLDALMGIGAVLPEEEPEPEIEIERIYVEEDEEDEAEVEDDVEEVLPEPEEEVEICSMYGCPTADYEPVVEEVAEEEPAEEEVTVEEEVSAVEPIVNDEIDHEAVLSLYGDDDEEEESVNDEVEAEVAEDLANEMEDIVAEESEVEEESAVAEEFAEEEVVVLEDDEPELEKVPDAESQKVVLGDILLGEQTTIADNLADQGVVDVATAASSVLTLRETIGVNDKYILMRDLFASNNDYYEQAIEKLDSFDSLDEAMLYIYDNFHWNPNCEGARLLMELLARKLF